jgi:glutamine cyclotransferase
MPKIFTVTFILLFGLSQSCGNKQNSQIGNGKKTPTNKQMAPATIKLESPLNGSNFTTADTVEIRYKALSDTLVVDSTLLSINGKCELVFNDTALTVPLAKSKMGMQRVQLTAYSSGRQAGTLSFVYTVKPQNPPKAYSYDIVNEHPHATDAYTQGLFFHNDFLYESTGEYGKSTLRKVDLKTGKALQNIKLDSKYFGEGISLFNNRIYQLSWQEHTGFIYNVETFEKIGEFNYSSEGWGITADGNYLIMSAGTANLYFFDPANMAIVKQIEAYSDTGSVSWLNELEYINGEIWANVYNKDIIARIDPETGEVKGLINLDGILKSTDKKKDTDVLNGIAYDPATSRIFVTGKRWPKLFEIKVIEK